MRQDRRGVAVIEFALVLPLLSVLLLGVLGYGQYFLLAHSAQQIANDAARATIAGISQAERVTIANAVVTQEVAGLPSGRAGKWAVAVGAPVNGMVTVRVRMDATDNALLRMSVLPMPDAVIERSGTVRQGGLE